MTFGEFLQSRRKKAGLTQAAAAEAAGIPLRTWQSWERGSGAPVTRAFFAAAEAVRTRPEEFNKAMQDQPLSKARHNTKGTKRGVRDE